MSILTKYNEEVIPQLKQSLGVTNKHALPKMVKIVVHVGVGKRTKEANFLDHVRASLGRITGQKPVDTVAKKSISNFKLRKGSVIGMMVTLRGERMYDFFEKMIAITMPRIPDFRGISKASVDAQGNLHIGFKDHMPFPETRIEDSTDPHGLQVSVITNAASKAKGLALFEALGVPFKATESKK